MAMRCHKNSHFTLIAKICKSFEKTQDEEEESSTTLNKVHIKKSEEKSYYGREIKMYQL